MKYDLTANIDVTDGLTNGSSCEIKVIENKQPEKTSRPSIVWVRFHDGKIGSNNRTKYSNLYHKQIDVPYLEQHDGCGVFLLYILSSC
jgi:hypothetical protein